MRAQKLGRRKARRFEIYSKRRDSAALWALKEVSLEATYELIDCLKNRESAESTD
jgi:hypothetical protein